MAENTCGDCACCKDIVDGIGLCKKHHPETHFTSDAPNRVIRRDNGWPKVNITDTACVEDFEVK